MNISNYKPLSTVLLTVLLLSCSSPEQTVSETEQDLTSGIELENMDPDVRPQDNFYQFVNGNWMRETEIPSDRVRWGSFDELREAAEEHVLNIVKEAAEQEAEYGSDIQKIGDLYRSYMDTLIIEDLGATPLLPELSRIDSISSRHDLVIYWGENQQFRFGSPIAVYVGQDQMQSDQYITSITQSGLGMPDRDDYLNEDDRSEEIRTAYKKYITHLFELAGLEYDEQTAESILETETLLAEVQWSRTQNRDRQATYNKVTTDSLQDLAPGFDWQNYLDAAKLGDIDEIIVRQPSYLSSFADIQNRVSLDDWKTYLRFHAIARMAPNLSSDFADAHFDFNNRTLSGQEEQRSRERRAVATVERTLGFLVGKLYVEHHFPQEASDRMDELVDNLIVAFRESILELDWMSDATKQEALDKLSTFNTKIGYPEVWRDYECIEIRPEDLIGNLMASSVCEYERNIGRLGQEVDTDEWGMTPQTVNAYYHPTLNEIVFPAAILQPPFFDVEAEDAVNYGAIGAVIGHEITHGFDDQGRRSDGEGNLRDWWTDEDEERFQERAQLMIDQYSSFNPIDDLYLQGDLGLGENIADLGGVNVALRAYRNSLGGQDAPVIDGFTGEQRFFIGWGQIWRTKFRDEALRRQVIMGPHSPGKYRVLGVLSNMPEFYKAFDVSPEDSMYRDEKVRVRIW